MKKLVSILILGLFVTACHTREAGPMERAGERVDEIADNVAEGRNPLHKKSPIEKLGESIDEATDGDGR